jgi:hypothetical protein
VSVGIEEGAAFDRGSLRRAFSSVPIGLKLLGGPMNTGSPLIFQMNIEHSKRFGEYFQIWPGHRGNEIEVLDVDRARIQLVLRVKEPRRRYVEAFQKRSYWSPEANRAHAEERARSTGGRVLKETRYDWRIEMWTSAVDRRYLCGRDDLHLFIAQFGAGDTVAEAHESLKPEIVRRVDAERPGCVQRQGEWFFLPPSDEEEERLARHLETWPGAVKERSPVGRGGRPHVADAVVRIDRRTRTEHREYRRPEVYAQGTIRHPDHRDVQLDGWRRVVRNAELGGSNDGLRVKWID